MSNYPPPSKRVVGFDNIATTRIALRELRDEMKRRMRAGAERGAEQIELAARSTTSFEDDTSATRESTLAYVYDASDYPTNFPEQSRANAELLNPGSGDTENIPPPPSGSDIVIALIASTNYSFYLTIRNGSQGDFISGSVYANADSVLQAIAAEVGGLFNGS